MANKRIERFKAADPERWRPDMGDDWHEFFKDFPDMDPANSHLSEEELAKLNAPGWTWVDEQSARDAAQREKVKEACDDEPDPA